MLLPAREDLSYSRCKASIRDQAWPEAVEDDAELQAGRIPEGLLQIQRAFLQSLEDNAKATPDYRTYRRGIITEGEEQNRIRMENNVVVLRRIAEHFERLAAKYEWFQWHPWLPIEPDPPVPN
jgi:hypothetical protein